MQNTHLHLLYILPLLSIFFFSSSSSSSSPPIDSFVYGGCSQLKFAPESAYRSNVGTLLTSLLNSANISPYNNFTISSPPNQDSTLYGLFQCRSDISNTDCSRCVQTAVSQIGILCPDSCSGVIQLQGCFIKYDNVSFLGVLDKTLVAKKCGGVTNGYGSDLLSKRDEVLTQLASGSDLFRVGHVGYLSGMAQCVGDLSSGQCTECLIEAGNLLRSGCGTTVSGDVFLAKCYVKYTATGVYDKSGTDSEDEAGKPLALVIGLLAAVALIIVFLSFLRKICEGGKR